MDVNFSDSLGSDAAKGFLQDISVIKISKNRQTVELLPQLYINKDIAGYTISIGFKIGVDKLYVVKDVQELFGVIGTNESIEYGKNFTFDDSIHVFDNSVRGLINILIIAMRKRNQHISPQKEYVLNGSVKTSVLRELASAKCEIFIDSRPHPHMQIINDNIPLELSLSKENECYRVDFEDCIGITPISEDCSICLWQDDLYVVSIEQAGCILAFLKAYTATKQPYIVFAHEDKSKIIVQALPKLRVSGNLQIDQAVKKDVVVGDLKVKMYIDKSTQEDIRAKVLFCYDNVEFNHFAGEKPAVSGKVLLRDRRQENAFIRLAAESGFFPEKGYLYIFEDNKIYDFITEGAGKLREFGDIYYSVDFNIRVIAPKRGSAGVSLSGGNLLDFQIDFEGIDKDELSSVLQSVKEKKKYYRLKSGNFVDLNAMGIRKTMELIDNLDIQVSKLENTGAKVPVSRAFFLDTSDSEYLEIKRDEYFDNFIEKFQNTNIDAGKLPDNLVNVLRPYQVMGFKWLKLLSSYGFGGILADEMGLGKTVQAIAFVISEYEQKHMPTLIIAPTSLLYNWQAEIQKFAPGAVTCIVSGTPAERRKSAKLFENCHFVITSYGLLRRDIDMYIKNNFSYCFIDEAQHIKNPNTINAKAVKRIKAECFFALTGTPLENTLIELWSIFDFIMPGYLYSKHKFRKMYELPIIKEEDKGALNNLLKHIRPFILRRLKSQVMSELPEKIESYMVSELEPQQKMLYAAYAMKAKTEIDYLAGNGGLNKNRIKILAIITRLRQLCCHPSLFVEGYMGSSGKLEMLKEIVEDAMQSGHRILIFSQFTSMLNIISTELSKMGIDYYYLDGNTKSDERFKMVNEFNSGGNDVFLISLKAGGTGLNLTGADMVIHYDPWWNPAVENQATDRAHRIGQTRMVQVLKLVSKGTIEEKICNLQKVKQDMIDSVIETGETLLSTMSIKEIQSLFD